MRYHFGWEDIDGRPLDAPAGKLLRPALCMLACEAVGGSADVAVPAAVAIELLHNFTLIHDDIEDASATRHGRATLWKVAGVPQAINAGDGMFVLAHIALRGLRAKGLPAERVLEAQRILDDACVTLCEGQCLDIGFEDEPIVTRPAYERMIAGKSAALIGASMAIGALAGGANAAAVSAFEHAGVALGLAFQVQDDALGVWGDAEMTGKPVADDIRSRKKSFPAVFAYETLPADERSALARIYAQPRLSEPDVATVLRLLDEAGARDAATQAANRHAAAAKDALSAVAMGAEQRADIEAIADFAVAREA
jgi:geranylgeranyl diphosphate synthase type I